MAEANQRGGDYSGKGVHVAARIAAPAGTGEIFASAETVVKDRPCPLSEPRSVAVKAVTEEVDIVSVLWR